VGYCLVVTVTTAIAFLLIPGRLVALFTRDLQVITDGCCICGDCVRQIGQSFELILEGALAGAAIHSGRKSSAPPSQRCGSHWRHGGLRRSGCSASGWR